MVVTGVAFIGPNISPSELRREVDFLKEGGHYADLAALCVEVTHETAAVKREQYPRAIQHLRDVLDDLPVISGFFTIQRNTHPCHLRSRLEWTDVAIDVPWYDNRTFRAVVTWLKRYSAAMHTSGQASRRDGHIGKLLDAQGLSALIDRYVDYVPKKSGPITPDTLPKELADHEDEYLGNVRNMKGLVAELFVALRFHRVLDNGLVVRGYVSYADVAHSPQYTPVEIDVIIVAPKQNILDGLNSFKNQYKDHAQISDRVYKLTA